MRWRLSAASAPRRRRKWRSRSQNGRRVLKDELNSDASVNALPIGFPFLFGSDSMDHFHYRDRVLHCEDVAVRKLAETYGTPLYVYSKATLLHHLSELQKA